VALLENDLTFVESACAVLGAAGTFAGGAMAACVECGSRSRCAKSVFELSHVLELLFVLSSLLLPC
jgi:hypothetical protein